MNKISTRVLVCAAAARIVSLTTAESIALAAPPSPPVKAPVDCKIAGAKHDQGPIVFTNVNVFTGRNAKLLKNATVLVDYVRTADVVTGAGKTLAGSDIGYFIKEVAVGKPLGVAYDRARARTIDGRGATLMPGLIDTHAHLSWANVTPMQTFARAVAKGEATFRDWPSFGQQASLEEAQGRLMSGFTSVREVGGVGHLVKECLDTSVSSAGVATVGRPGSRLWYAGTVISPTAGHADAESSFESEFHFIHDLVRMSVQEREDLVMTADAFGLRKVDGVAAVQRGVRDQFVKGAQFIKLATGGGSSSPHDPIDATTFAADEVAAATELTDGMNTYTTTHAYEGATIVRDLQHGVQMIEHGNLLTDEAARLLKKYEKRRNARGLDTSAWLDLSPFFDNHLANPKDGVHFAKERIVQKGTLCAYGLAKKYDLQNVGVSFDVMFEVGGAVKVPKILANLPRDLAPLAAEGLEKRCPGLGGKYGYSNFDVLKMVTYNNGRILTKSGPRTPYAGADGTYLKEGAIGVIAPGAVADILLVDGNPLEDLAVFEDVEKNLRLIMKDGVVYKNTLP